MKRIYILFAISFLMIDGANAQNGYFDNNPKWQVNYSDATNYPCVTQCWFLYSTNGDTVINSRTYKKIVVSGDCYTSWLSMNTNFNCVVGFGGGPNINNLPHLRDSAHIIYGLTNSNIDTVLFDYNLHIGDTVRIGFANNNFAGYPIVVGIDSIPISNFYRKRFQLSSNYTIMPDTAYLIEGIGSSFGLSECLCPMIEGDFHLACYSLNDTTYYPHTGPSCNVAVGIKNDEKLNTKISVSPNPANTTITIHSTLSMGNYRLSIEDVLGNKIYQQTITANDTKIDASKWSAGVYFYVVNGIRGKFVVIRN